MAVGVEKESVEIIKPRNDKREYRRIVLQNSLQALLISDPDTDKILYFAIIVDVITPKIGKCFGDLVQTPQSLNVIAPGEHNNTFPESQGEKSVSPQSTSYGGEAKSEQMLYWFQTRWLELLLGYEELLTDQLAMCRLLTACTGNWDTLEVRPKARGLDTRQELLKFYEENYSANLMHLVVYAKGWAASLSAGESDSVYEFSFFNVNIDLTDAGHAICETGFHYQDKVRPINYVVNVASNMQLYPPKDWLVGSSLPSNYSPGIIQSVLNELTPNNVSFLISPTFESGRLPTSIEEVTVFKVVVQA
ncbi:hypothetical protein RJ639_046236 [Escallonia herrerae]|uniref:Peptidase M16 middle/third domain-containing protein n=1 Tax=Escallonia herrerae TaxID=1293975 RepID=A0AA88W856_9ASTE|nr:hypothetical protein RJ639_046236 [Escallonia herrerae]